jgi:2-C-methyl-D-erythritol 4-phosphate cytidylyltransferase
MSKPTAIILAAGSGERFGGRKQFVEINDTPLFIHTVKKFVNYCERLILVVPSEDTIFGGLPSIVYSLCVNHLYNVEICFGGKTRQESVWNALNFLKGVNQPSYVIISDANRPLISEQTIKNCIAEVYSKKAVVAVSKSVNTCCIGSSGYLHKHLDRTAMYELQMPQVFDYETLYKAHQKSNIQNATDDAQLIPSEISIKMVEIPRWEGIKVTYPEDLSVVEFLLKEQNRNDG